MIHEYIYIFLYQAANCNWINIVMRVVRINWYIWHLQHLPLLLPAHVSDTPHLAAYTCNAVEAARAVYLSRKFI